MKYFYKFHTPWLVIIGLLFISSCDIIDSLKKDKKDDNETEDQIEFVDGISRDILEFVSEEELSVLEDTLGVQIYRGNNPPKINGTFKISPLLLSNTNIEGDVLDSRFTDLHLRLYDQDDRLFTIEIDRVETSVDTDEIVSTSVGVGSFLIGEGNGFSIFAKVHSTMSTGEESIMLELFTGKIAEGGIRDFQLAILMLDNKGRDDIFIKNGAGRAFVDSDGFSELSDFPSSKIVRPMVDQKTMFSTIINQIRNH